MTQDSAPRVRVFLGGIEDLHGEDGVDWDALTPGTVPWDENPSTLLWYVSDLLSARVAPSAAHAWYVYAEQGYGQCVLLGSFILDSDPQRSGITVAKNLEHCPHTRFVHCERIPLTVLDMMKEEELQGKSVGGFGSHLQAALQAQAVLYTHYEPCRYTYTDDDAAHDLAKIEAKNAARKPCVVYPVTIAALVLGGLLMMALKVGLWPGVSAGVGAVLILLVLPIAAAEAALVVIARLKEPRLAQEILRERLPVGPQTGEHHAVFSYGPRETIYSDESTSKRFGTGTERYQETEHFVFVTFEDGTIIPVDRLAL